MQIFTAQRKTGNRAKYEAVEFTGNMSESDVARWAKGRLKGASGRFVIEIDTEGGDTLIVPPIHVILRSAKGATTVLPSLEFRTKFNYEPKEDTP